MKTIRIITSKEEVMATIQEAAAALGRVPRLPELMKRKGMTMQSLRKTFGNYTEALRACDMAEGKGMRRSLGTLFAEWVRVAREMGRVPSMIEYGLHSTHSPKVLAGRFGGWKHVPQQLLEHAAKNNLAVEWRDVLEMIRGKQQPQRKANSPSGSTRTRPQTVVLTDRPLYGPWLMMPGLAHAPVNEAGVLFLFGMLAEKLGFVVTWIGTVFPDCEAVREVTPGRWQRMRIELEYQSRNFVSHGHDRAGCDLIVCWEDNWPDCPMEVLELKEAVKKLQAKEGARSSEPSE